MRARRGLLGLATRFGADGATSPPALLGGLLAASFTGAFAIALLVKHRSPALFATPALAQPASPSRRLLGTDEAPPPGTAPSRERVVMRLDYTAVDGCPDDQLVRAAIGARVRRWDPFAPNAPWHLTVSIVRRAGYEGTAELRNVTDTVEWARPRPRKEPVAVIPLFRLPSSVSRPRARARLRMIAHAHGEARCLTP